MWDKIGQYFTGRGLHEVNLNHAGMRLFYAAEGRAADSVLLVNDEVVETLSREQYERYLGTIRKIFEQQGFETVNQMTLFVTSRVEQCKAVGEGSAYWIVDGDYGRLIIYEDQPEDYLGIRAVIENNLHFGGHSRNADGAQSGWRQDTEIIGRDKVTRIDDSRAGAYLAEKRQRQRVLSSQRNRRFANVCIVTIVLIVINLIIFLMTDLFEWETLLAKGWISWKDVFENGEYYRLFTCMFLHFGVDHVGGNMIALYAFGDVIERQLKKVNYILLYILSGLGASVISCLYYHYLAETDSYSVGASGAIYGLMGAMLIMLVLHPEQRRREYGMRFAVFAVYILYSFLSASENTNIAAHFGGLVCGAVLFPILEWVEGRRRRAWKRKTTR